jgi:V-type H+-transporting ATPase subunit a
MQKLSNQTATKFVAYDQHAITPPTYFKATEFTATFQQVVDTYGIPSYKEANPAVFAIVTFPFLFGMMFGDLGHGSIIFFFGGILTLFAGSLRKSGVAFILPFRYFIMLMGFFAAYCGFIYNDWFAFPLQMFESCYDNNKTIY